LHQGNFNPVIMRDFTIISQRLEALKSLSQKDTIVLDDLRDEFRPDIKRFIVGETLSMRDGKIVIGNNLYRRWLHKIQTKGFDYEIDFK
jgi:hypothetical protein